MIKHTICLDIELYCYYEVSYEFSNVIFNDHINIKCCKRRSLGDNYFNKALGQSELTLMGVRQNKNFGSKNNTETGQ